MLRNKIKGMLLEDNIEGKRSGFMRNDRLKLESRYHKTQKCKNLEREE